MGGLYMLTDLAVLIALFVSIITLVKRNRKKCEYGNLILKFKDRTVKGYLSIALAWFAIGFFDLIEAFTKGTPIFESMSLAFLIGSFALLIQSLLDTQIRERGIITKGTYWMWKDVEMYNFTGNSTAVVFILANNTKKIIKPSLTENDKNKLKEELDKILEQKLNT